MIVTSNKPFSGWGEIFGDDVTAAAMIDRLVHRAEILALKGDSYSLKDRDLARPNAAATAETPRPIARRGPQNAFTRLDPTANTPNRPHPGPLRAASVATARPYGLASATPAATPQRGVTFQTAPGGQLKRP
jgi:hypothetical protein